MIYPMITLWQPWATLVAAELKPWEFRSWPAPKAMQGRRIGVHAGARKTSLKEVRALLVKLHSERWRETGLLREGAIALLEHVKTDPSILPLGSVLCLVTLGQPVRNADLARRLGIDACDDLARAAFNDSDRNQHSNWGWPLTTVEPLRPHVPARGAQGFWYFSLLDEAAARNG